MSWDINKKVGRPKKSVKPFGSDAQTGERTVFGSNSISDDLEENLSVDFERGWGIVPQESPPTRQDFNAGMFTNSLLASYLFQQGVPEWDGNQAYFINSIVQKDGQLFVSTDGTDGAANIGNDPGEGAKWVVVSGGGGGGSGTNLITNPQASQGVSGWKMTGGVFESQNSDDGVGGKVFKVTMNADGNVLVNDAAYVTNDTASLVNTCSLYYKQTGGASDITAVDVLIESSDDGNVWTELKRETLSDVGLDKWGYYQTQVVFPDIGSQIRFSFVATGATQFDFDNVHLGSIVGATGAFIGDWEDFAPEIVQDGLPVVAQGSRFRRVGSSIEIYGSFQLDVNDVKNATPALDITIALPDINLDIPSNYLKSNLGTFAQFGGSGVPNVMGGDIRYAGDDNIQFIGNNQRVYPAGTRDYDWSNTGNIVYYSYLIQAPVKQWQGQGTSIAMTESLVESNYRFESAQVKESKIAANTNGSLACWDSSKSDIDEYGEYYTVPADGYYSIFASTSIIDSKFSGDANISCAFKGTGVYLHQQPYHFESVYRPFLSMQTYAHLKKGDTFRIQVKNFTDAEITLQNETSPPAVFRVDRIPDYTAGTLPSFGIATESEYGLVKAAQVFSVGSIQQSILTEAQFQAENGADWKLWGASTDIAGTKLGGLLGTDTLPDATGRVFRNAGGEAADVGEGQDDATAVNGLVDDGNLQITAQYANPVKYNVPLHLLRSANTKSAPDEISFLNTAVQEDVRGQYSADSAILTRQRVTLAGDTETRMINITLNTFIKVN